MYVCVVVFTWGTWHRWVVSKLWQRKESHLCKAAWTSTLAQKWKKYLRTCFLYLLREYPVYGRVCLFILHCKRHFLFCFCAFPTVYGILHAQIYAQHRWTVSKAQIKVESNSCKAKWTNTHQCTQNLYVQNHLPGLGLSLYIYIQVCICVYALIDVHAASLYTRICMHAWDACMYTGSHIRAHYEGARSFWYRWYGFTG